MWGRRTHLSVKRTQEEGETDETQCTEEDDVALDQNNGFEMFIFI